VPEPIRWPVTAEAFERVRGSVSLELWQLRDAVDGRVSNGAVVTALVLQSMARTPARTWPGLERMAALLRTGSGHLELHLRELEVAGWIDRVAVDGAVHVVCRTTKRSVDEPAADAPNEQPATSSETEPATRSMFGGEAEDPNEPAPAKKAAAKKKRKIQRADLPADVVALTSELLERYPHGRTERDTKRAASRGDTEDQLVALLDGLEPAARARLCDEIRAGVRVEADSAPPLDHADRRYVKSLARWLNTHGWRDARPAQRLARLPADPKEAGGARVGFHVGATRPAAPDAVPVPTVDPAALARARARRASDPGDGP
jgi:hypothetical protein